MKKGFFCILLLLFSLSLSAQNLPESFYGLWEGKDRYVFFEENEETKELQISIVLKTFYGWYYDRAAEPLSYNDLETRDRNDSSSKEAVHIGIQFQDINASFQEDNAYEVCLTYAKNDKAIVPAAVLDGKMYLNFYIKNLTYDDNNNPVITSSGVWRGSVISKGILISDQMEMDNIPALLVTQNKYYNVRYWKSDMDFSTENAILQYENEAYYVPKHIYSAGNVYSCVTGKRTKIRNVWPPFEFSEDDYLFNADKTLMIPKQEPYLIQIADKKTVQDLMKIVKEANARKAPPAPPLFPQKDLDWHWDLILAAEEGNPYVQEVRKHQAQRGYIHKLK